MRKRNLLPKVSMIAHKNFFDNVFEPKRKAIQKQLGLTNLTQVQFTAMIKDLKLNIKINKPKQSKKFSPRGRFNL